MEPTFYTLSIMIPIILLVVDHERPFTRFIAIAYLFIHMAEQQIGTIL